MRERNHCVILSLTECLGLVKELRSSRGAAEEKQRKSRGTRAGPCVMLVTGYVRVGGLDVLPALAEVLPELAKRTEAQLPLQLGGVSLFGGQDLTQRVDLFLHLEHTQPRPSVTLHSYSKLFPLIACRKTRLSERLPPPTVTTRQYLNQLGAQLFSLLLRQAGWDGVGRVSHRSLYGDVGQAVGVVGDQAFVGGVQVDVCSATGDEREGEKKKTLIDEQEAQLKILFTRNRTITLAEDIQQEEKVAVSSVRS